MDLDFPSDQSVTGRTGLATTNWTFLVFPTTYADITSGAYTTGFPGVTIDSRNTDPTLGSPDSTKPAYTNNLATSPISGPDNTSLAVPGSPGLFIGQGDKTNGGVIRNFIRLFPSDIAPDPADSVNKRGVWLQKLYTGENCSNKTFRWVLCSPLYTDP